MTMQQNKNSYEKRAKSKNHVVKIVSFQLTIKKIQSIENLKTY